MAISKKAPALLATILITLLIPEASFRFAGSLSESFSILWNYLHHLCQMFLALIITIILAICIKNESFSKLGYNIHNWRWSLKTAIVFSIGYFLISLVVMALGNSSSFLNYELSLFNIIADLFFDFFITPLSEEILFRGLIMGILLVYIKKKIRIGGLSISIAGILTAVLFSLAHIGIDYHIFTITYFNPVQLLFAFGLGLFYAYMREKSGSLLGPIIAHGASDGILTIIALILP